jgi:abortive infection bacteriophage resistance protein
VLFCTVKYPKPSLTPENHIAKWKGRGLIVLDEDEAKHYLEFIGYFRLSAYARPFQDSEQHALAAATDKPFREGTTFKDILNLYVFDRELRLLVMDAVERIEVAVRACISNTMCHKFGPHWFMDKNLFYQSFRHENLIRKIEHEVGIKAGQNAPDGEHHEPFINHYYKNYGDPYLPPAWIVAEMLSIGSWSKIFSGIKSSEERKAIALHFKQVESVLQGWLHVVSHARNLCAHHSRLWNRRFVIKSELSRKHAEQAATNDRFYAVFLILRDLMMVVSPKSEWEQRIFRLFLEHSCIPIEAMGFVAGWKPARIQSSN